MTSSDAVLVTGASTGIGKAIVERLAGDGHRVFAAVRDLSTVEPRPRVTPVRLDVTSSDEARAAAETVRAALGTDRLRGVVNNAGIAVGGPLEFLELDELRHQLEVYLVGQLAVTQAFLPLLRDSGVPDPRIVFVSSISGHVAPPYVGPYAASKHAVIGMAGALRKELLPWGFKVSILSPGNVTTPIWGKGKAAVDELTASAPAKAREYYGDVFAMMDGLMDDSHERGVPPSAVADKCSHALFDRKPKAEYIIGADAKQMLTASRMLPTGVFDRLVIRELKRRGGA